MPPGKYGKMIEKNFWKNRKVLITGHTGFKGSWLALWLNLMGAEVTGYALEPRTGNDNFVLTALEQKINSRIADIRNFPKLSEIFTQQQPEIVFHLAAQPIVRESYKNPKTTFDTNLGGTVNLLECCRLTDSVRTIVNVTSDKCYENREQSRGFQEDDRLGGFDPYSASKAGSEIVSAAYRQSFFNPNDENKHKKSLATARAGNVIGGGDWQKDRLIPDCLLALQQNRPIIIRNPSATRPWQNVLEPLSGYLLLAEKMYNNPGRYDSAWNFGPEDESIKTVGELVNLTVKLWGKGSWESPKNENEPHEATLLQLNISKAKTVLGWTPKWNMETGLQKTISWYKKFFQNSNFPNMYDFAVKQILEYQSIANS